MSKNVTKRPWSAQEIEYLKIGFQQNIRLKIIAKVLKRSETSVNKALSRFGIRPYGLKGRIKNGKKAISDPTEINFKKIIDQHCQKSGNTSFLPKKEEKNKQSNSSKKEKKGNKISLKTLENYQYLWKNSEPNALDLKENWVDFEAALALLKNGGDRISCLKNHLEKRLLFINGKPFTAHQMLLRLNQHRVHSGLNPIYITNVTEF